MQHNMDGIVVPVMGAFCPLPRLPLLRRSPPASALARRRQPLLAQAVLTRRQCLQVLATLATLHAAPAIAKRGLPAGAAAQVLESVEWGERWESLYSAGDFARFDGAPDALFYSAPRLLHHVDDGAVGALRAYYKNLLAGRADVLDLCSSFESYLPTTWEGRGRVAGLGMNLVELESNAQLTERVVLDLNAGAPKLPYADASFDLVLIALSVDYLTKPREVLRETARVLRPRGEIAVSFSDRVFGTKAVALWTSGSDADHIYNVASFLHYAGGFSRSTVVDLSPRKNKECTGDPLYLVRATRLPE